VACRNRILRRTGGDNSFGLVALAQLWAIKGFHER